MTTITVYKNNSNQYIGFDASGHSGYANAGEDIVCAAISVLVINTCNSLDCLTETELDVSSQEDLGDIKVRFISSIDQKASLLMESMILGLEMIREEYGNNYITLKFEEV